MWLRLGALLGITVVLYGLMFLTGATTPKLGLDLQGGTSVTLTPRLVQGTGRPTSGSIDKAVDIIRQRVNGLGVSEADVRRAGDRIEIAVPGKGREEVVDLVGQTAQLNFREVLQAAAAKPAPAAAGSAAPAPAAPTPAAPTPSKSAAPAPAKSGAPAPAAKPSSPGTPRAAAPVGAPDAGSLGPAAAATPSPVVPGAAQPAATAPAATAPAAPAPGAAATAPTPGGATAADTPPTDVIQRFIALTCNPADLRSSSSANDLPQNWTVACDRDGQTKYLLKPATVIGTDVSGATATIPQSQTGTGQWTVSVQFTSSGQAKFTRLTELTTGKQVAIVLDGVVQSAPNINERIPGSAEISGSFTQSSAEDLANILKYGALPLAFDKSQAESISATLGADSLRAGLIAGGIGLVLVLLYSFLYYRALGFITVASLAISGVLIYACVCLLGKAIGFTLTLAGVAGLIVAVGVTADSFVVFYERIKDEVREGRTVRTGVDRAWVRARRTIISADTVSLLAAVALYLLSIGSVRGFAFTLGLSTLLDLVVVFLFTHPLVAILMRKPFFSTGRYSGLQAPRSGGDAPAAQDTAAPTARTRLTKRTTVGSAAAERGQG
ncbi:MAG: preprotein translocase subunit SecD [Frankiaceae bacterium]|nr:preprotein translocase subunit SecD [Frankiaceae bacterium]